MLEIDNISASYGDIKALRNLSLHIEKGKIVSLIGPNGSGKTTLLNTISGLIKPDDGTINFVGKRIDDLKPSQIANLGISQVPEGRKLFPDLTVLENLKIGSYNSRARKSYDQNLEYVFELFPILKERTNQLAKTLSGGEAQMCAIGRALMSNPKLILFDEISLGLAPNVISRLYEAVQEIRSKGYTLLIVEQSLRRSLEAADESCVIRDGKIVLRGSTDDIREQVEKAYFE